MPKLLTVAQRAGIVALFVIAAILGIATGVLFAFAGDLPHISALDDYAPSTISRVYGARGEIVGEFAIERREVIPYEKISPRLEQAILAAVENLDREDMAPLDEAELFATLRPRVKPLAGEIPERAIARLLHVSERTVFRRLLLTHLNQPGAAKNACLRLLARNRKKRPAASGQTAAQHRAG